MISKVSFSSKFCELAVTLGEFLSLAFSISVSFSEE